MSDQVAAKPTLSRRIEGYQPSKTVLFWSCVVVAIATIVVGFSWGGWVTGGSSRAAVIAAGETARGQLASAICVERFNAAPDAAAKLMEFKAISSGYAQRQFVEAGGWATMPGETTPNSAGASGCVTALGSQS
ncbi:hypothetical protein [Radicibacter daui]|uniref:hypothetical protein n=1 Tax=Radicibacter daui TaxID=3064829 RepID=UPI004046EED2